MNNLKSEHEFSHLSDDELEAIAVHVIPVKILEKLCDPWSAWAEQEQSIKKEDVLECLKAGQSELTVTPLWTDISFGRSKITPEENRIRHIQKIAWFVQNGFADPISLEVGCAGLGVAPGHLIEDGNHRFAAAILRQDKVISAKIGGGIEDAKRMGLWRPNEAHKELERRWDTQAKSRKRSKISP